MATSSISLNSATATFSGSSTYANDLQSAISRAVAFASLPVTQLQNKSNDLTSQVAAIGSLNSQFQSVSTALSNLESAVNGGSLSANAGDSTVLSASLGTGATAGAYTVNIANIGSQTNGISADGLTTVTDPTSGNFDSASKLTLTVDGTDYSIANSGSLNSLAQAINASGAGVSATVINIGGSLTPDYRLSILSNKYSPSTITLSDGTNSSLLHTLSTGSYVTYQVNGQPSTPINSTSRTFSFASGLSVTALKAGSTTVNVTTSGSQVSYALSNLATAYNTAFDELSKSRGQNGGALSGQSIVSSLSSTLRSLFKAGTASGNIRSLSDLGLSYDKNGHLNFDSGAFSTAMSTNGSQVLAFLGSSTSGFLQQAESAINSADDPTTGILQTTSTDLGTQIGTIATKITNLQGRITTMQNSLTKKMVTADTLITQLQNQTSYYTNLFAQIRANQISGR